MGSERILAFARDCIHVRDPIVRAVIGTFLELYLPGLKSEDAGFVEMLYLAANPDVELAVRRGELTSGYHHWRAHGQREGRPLAPDVVPQKLYDLGVLDPPTPPPGA